MDFEKLLENLTSKDTKIKNSIPNEEFSLVSDGSFSDLMQRANEQKYGEVSTILGRIRSNLKFTQSLAQNVAMDDMIEPVTCVVNEAIRRGPNLGASLRGGSVASSAQVFRHLASRSDHAAYSVGRRTNYQNNYSKKGTRSRENRGKFKSGYCFTFQKTGSCHKKDCDFKQMLKMSLNLTRESTVHKVMA